MDTLWDLINGLASKIALVVFRRPEWQPMLSMLLLFLSLYLFMMLFLGVFKGIRDRAKRTELFSVGGAVIVNAASAYAITNRPKPFGFADIVIFFIFNAMFGLAYYFANSRWGVQDLEDDAKKRAKIEKAAND